MHLRRAKKRSSILNVTPMIDVVFILLVFFMLTTQFDQFRLIGIEAPEETEVVMDADAAIVILVRDDGTYLYDGDEMDLESIRASVAGLVAIDPGRAFLVRPQPGVSIQDGLDVFQAARDSGAVAVSFSRYQEGASE